MQSERREAEKEQRMSQFSTSQIKEPTCMLIRKQQIVKLDMKLNIVVFQKVLHGHATDCGCDSEMKLSRYDIGLWGWH